MRTLILCLGLLLAGLTSAMADEDRTSQGASLGASLGPVIPKATGDPHPEGNAWMRRHHMELMKHDRDVTMYQGEWGLEGSIAGCFECHTARDETGTPVTYEDDRHFCRACHDFVAVRVDCFDCHRSTPEGFDEPAPHARLQGVVDHARNETDEAATLLSYLEGLETPRPKETK